MKTVLRIIRDILIGLFAISALVGLFLLFVWLIGKFINIILIVVGIIIAGSILFIILSFLWLKGLEIREMFKNK